MGSKSKGVGGGLNRYSELRKGLSAFFWRGAPDGAIMYWLKLEAPRPEIEG